MNLGLVDDIGYLEDATESASKLAGLSNPKIVRYSVREGFWEQLSQAKAGPVIDINALDEVQTPKMMMIWKIGQ